MFLMLFCCNLQLHCQLLVFGVNLKATLCYLGDLWVEGEGGGAAIYAYDSAVGADKIFCHMVITAFQCSTITNTISIIY